MGWWLAEAWLWLLLAITVGYCAYGLFIAIRDGYGGLVIVLSLGAACYALTILAITTLASG